MTLDGGSTEQLSRRLSVLEEQATATLRDQVLMCHLRSQSSTQEQIYSFHSLSTVVPLV